MKLDNVSFSKEGYDKFKELSKEEQISKLANKLNPKDNQRAKFLLKNVPHGNIVRRDEQKTGEDNTSGLGESDGEDNSKRYTSKKRKDT